MSGDSEPEDAWHPDDPLEVRLDNIARRLRLALDDLIDALTRLRDDDG